MKYWWRMLEFFTNEEFRSIYLYVCNVWCPLRLCRCSGMVLTFNLHDFYYYFFAVYFELVKVDCQIDNPFQPNISFSWNPMAPLKVNRDLTWGVIFTLFYGSIWPDLFILSNWILNMVQPTYWKAHTEQNSNYNVYQILHSLIKHHRIYNLHRFINNSKVQFRE